MTMAEGDSPSPSSASCRAAMAPQPPPARMTGARRLGARQSVLHAVQHRPDHLALALLVCGSSRRSSSFLVVDAVWTGSDRDACRADGQHREVGACWPFVGDRLAYFIYGSYPIAAALAGRRLLRAAGGRRRLAAVAAGAAARPRRGLLLRRAADLRRSSCCTAWPRSACRWSIPCCGAACW